MMKQTLAADFWQHLLCDIYFSLSFKMRFNLWNLFSFASHFSFNFLILT